MITIEVCINSVPSAIAAEAGGAHRVELCAALPEGGTTPSFGTVKKALELVQIPVFPIIRPRGGDFIYSETELAVMVEDIRAYRDLGAQGFSFGVLDKDGRLNKEANARLIEACGGRPATLHRAFDRTCDLEEELEVAIQLGFKRILTSGGEVSAPKGVDRLARLVRLASGRISIMAGAGIRPDNVRELVMQTGVKEVHGTFQSEEASQMSYKSPAFPTHYTETVGEFTSMMSDTAKISSVLQNLSGL